LAFESTPALRICYIFPYWMSRYNLGRNEVIVELFFSSLPFSSELARTILLRRETVLWALCLFWIKVQIRIKIAGTFWKINLL